MSRQYLSAGGIIEEVLAGKSLKAYCASRENLGKVDYALAMETMKYKDTIVQLLESCNISAQTLDVREGVLLVMIYELLFGAGKIQGGGGVKRKVMEHQANLANTLEKLMKGKSDHSELLSQSVLDHAKIGAFIRVNTVKISAEEGLAHATKLNSAAVWDAHIPSLISLPPLASSLGQDEWVKSGKFIIQDKASCFPSQILHDAWLTLPVDPIAGSRGDFIDACAAPGNKTSHLATLAISTNTDIASAAQNRKSTVYAFEKNPRRAQLLRDRMTIMGVDTTVTVSNSDFLEINVTDPKFTNVTAILLDPSCSGSGVAKSLERALETSGGQEDSGDSAERLASLQAFQLKVIQKAMTFPRVQRIVYSTCSVYKEENEVVVAEILKLHGPPEDVHCHQTTTPGKSIAKSKSKASKLTQEVSVSGWRVVAPPRLSSWKRRGLPLTTTGEYTGATLTSEQSAALIRCAPEDGTNGFFVSLFERVGPLQPVPTYDPSLTVAARPVVTHQRKNKRPNDSFDSSEGRQQQKFHKVKGAGTSTATANTFQYPHRKEKTVKVAKFLGKFKVQKRKK